MRKTIATIVVLGLVLIGYTAWSLYDLLVLVRAIETRDVDTVTRHVYFDAVRVSLTNHDQEVSTILGKSVRSRADEDMGRIVDIIVSRYGQVHAAIIDFGGFLGIGTRKIAVDWRALNFAPAGKPGSITLDLTRNQVRLAPEYKRGDPVVVVSAAGAERTMPTVWRPRAWARLGISGRTRRCSWSPPP
jgi:PRC-barrel domain/Protein of unknown function (DUF2939)